MNADDARRLAGGALAFFLMGTGCAEPAREAPRAVAAGAEMCELTSTEVAELGRMDDPVSIADPYMPPEVALLPDGGWAVVDGELRRVLRYSAEGDFLGYMDSRGEGPQEILVPGRPVVTPSDSILIPARTQGRWVVFDREGLPVRTISFDLPRGITGVTPGGLPWTVRGVRTHGPSPDGVHYGPVLRHGLIVQRYSAEGQPLEPFGPGLDVLREGGRASAGGAHVHAISDTVFLMAGEWDGADATRVEDPGLLVADGRPGIWRWTPGSVEPFVPEEAFVAELERLGLPPLARVTGLSPDGEGGFWVTGWVRMRKFEMPPELQAHAEAARAAAGGGTVFVPGTFLLMDQSHDGVAWHIDAEGHMSGALTFDALPRGMSGPGQYFTVQEDPATALVTVGIHALTRHCAEG